MSAQRPRGLGIAAFDAGEMVLAGAVSGVMYCVGGLTFCTFPVLPGVTHAHWIAVLGLGVGAAIWGLISLLAIRWARAGVSLIHFSVICGLVVIAAATASSGGASSPAWIYLVFVAVFASYFFPRRWALAYIVGCIATHALPLIYDSGATHDAFLAQFVIAAPAYLVLGGAISAGKSRMWKIRRQAEQLAGEQGALRRVATAVVSGKPPEHFYELVAFEAAGLLSAGAAGILRLESPAEATVLGSWADHAGGRYPPGTKVEIRPGSDVARALATRGPVRIDKHQPDSPVTALGYSSSIVTPIKVGDATWGVLAATAAEPGQGRPPTRSG